MALHTSGRLLKVQLLLFALIMCVVIGIPTKTSAQSASSTPPTSTTPSSQKPSGKKTAPSSTAPSQSSTTPTSSTPPGSTPSTQPSSSSTSPTTSTTPASDSSGTSQTQQPADNAQPEQTTTSQPTAEPMSEGMTDVATMNMSPYSSSSTPHTTTAALLTANGQAVPVKSSVDYMSNQYNPEQASSLYKIAALTAVAGIALYVVTYLPQRQLKRTLAHNA